MSKILNIEQCRVICYWMRQDVKAAEIHQKLVDVYGANAFGFSTIKHRIALFKTGRRQGAPKDVFTAENIEEVRQLVEANPRIKSGKMILSSGMVHTKNWRRNLKERWLTLSENGTLTWRRRDGYMIRGSTNIHQFFDKIDFDFDAYAASTAADDSSSCSSNDTVNSVKNVKNHGDTIDVKSTKIYLWILSVPIKMDVKTGRVKKWKNFRLATVAELDFWLQALANADGR
uniref:Uncharacterized protein n=1 Tax=Romanomermis culicivorax TaxID=13658 RepID=A0A915KFQ9_ROMCU